MSGNSCWNYFDNNSNDDVIGIVVLVLLLYPDYGSCRFGACSILGNSPCPFFRPVSRESTLDKMQKHLAMIWTLGHLVYCQTWELVTGYSHFSCQHLDRIYPPYFSFRSLFWWCELEWKELLDKGLLCKLLISFHRNKVHQVPLFILIYRERNLTQCENMVYAGSTTKDGQPVLTPPAILDGIAQLERMLEDLTQGMMDLMGDYNNKLKVSGLCLEWAWRYVLEFKLSCTIW